MYRGLANISTTNVGTDIITVDKDEYSFAIISKSVKYVCNLPVISTDYDGVFVVTTEHEKTNILSMSVKNKIDIDFDLIMNLKLYYIEQNVRNRTTELYNMVLHDLCKSMVLHLNNLLSMARTNPEEFAWSYTGQAGYTAINRGEVIYLIKCIPVIVSILETDLCYNEIPVLYKNKTMYLKPATRILSIYGNPIPCMPQLFYIHGKWTKITGEPYTPKEPQVLSANPDNLWNYGSLISERTIGYVPHDSLIEYKRSLLIPSERKVVTQIFASNELSEWHTQNTYHKIFHSVLRHPEDCTKKGRKRKDVVTCPPVLTSEQLMEYHKKKGTLRLCTQKEEGTRRY